MVQKCWRETEARTGYMVFCRICASIWHICFNPRCLPVSDEGRGRLTGGQSPHKCHQLCLDPEWNNWPDTTNIQYYKNNIVYSLIKTRDMACWSLSGWRRNTDEYRYQPPWIVNADFSSHWQWSSSKFRFLNCHCSLDVFVLTPFGLPSPQSAVQVVWEEMGKVKEVIPWLM